MATGAEIKAERERRGLSQAALAKEVGVSQPAIKKIEDGITLRSRVQADIEAFLGLALVAPSRSGYRPPPIFLGERDLPVFAAAEGGPGEMVVNTEPIDVVPRPWFLKEVRDGFAVLIVGESMVPVFEPGDMAIVNPRLPPMRNKNAIFTSGEDGGDFRASIKRLIRWDEETWHVQQFNEPKEFRLDRRQWPKALRVVGKYEG